MEWIDLDLPKVIAFRERLGEPKNPRHTLLAASVLDQDPWIPEVKRRARSHILFVAEGLLPYFTEDEHRTIFGMLTEHFPGHEMLFQTSAPSVIRGFLQHSDLKKLRTSAELRWGLEESADVRLLDPKVRFLAEFPLLTSLEGLPQLVRQRLSSDPMLRLSPDQIRKAAKIVHVRFA